MTVHQISGSFATTPDLMAAVVDTYPDQEAFIDGERRLTFAGWDRAALGTAATMADLGVGKGDVVCLYLPSSADYAVAYLAAMRLGAISTGINLRLGPGEVASIFARTEPRLVVCEQPEDLPVALPPGTAVLRRDQLAAAAAADPPARHPALRASDPVAIVWTSGTTGQPKGAVFDHANLAAMAAAAGALSRPGDRRISPLPFPHVGYMTRMWDELLHVITTVIVPAPWKAVSSLHLMEAEAVTVGQGVPAQWALMLAHPDFDGTDLSSLRLAGTGAASVPPELVREMRRRLGCPVIVRYTSTEACVSTGSRPGDPDEVIVNTVGRPEHGVELTLVDDDGHAVTNGEVGTVCLRSGAVMRGYWQDPERTAEIKTSDGWLLTGDLGSLDDDGNLTLVGRRSDMYIRGGYNVYPSEVEAVLTDHPAVERVAVVGLPDPVLGQIGAAFVVPPPGGAAPTSDELRAWARSRLADYKAPDRVAIVDDLPLTPMSKIDKRALLAMGVEQFTNMEEAH
jgi:acyl-CoA synthetase (AMP-forming)/AMP-acid ligase II